MQLNRRSFHKFLGMLGLASLFTKHSPLLAEECVELKSSDSPLNWEQENILTWVDGFHYQESEFNHRGSLAFLIKHQQTPSRYIDKVLLTDTSDARNVIAARYYGVDDKISSDFLPYFIVNNLSLSDQNYFIFMQVREENSFKHYRYTLSETNLLKSQLTGNQLPATVSFDLKKSKPVSPFSYFANSTFSIHDHTLTAHVLSIENNNFSILVNFLHDDISPKHYMRYFIITDPVGRILGISKREFSDTTKQSMVVTALTEAERDSWNLTKENVAKIQDCPYIMVFCEDVESIVKRTIWLH